MASSRALYDVIVIGAGIEGSSCAYNLAKEGMKVLLIEQFPLPHIRGSSHGQSRITRYAYSKAFYVRMMVDCFPMWAQLEKESGEDFFT
ncbi:peroxisomal sarcosine oxidase [Plakobranchus ocellatus]|uniref:Peroxisomal sarcosine oxidase n=1 Tax=Plakobranchus ocellatus TaxID=259542 RepID=A0AAV3Z0Q2_9GAST|nr:peroxisomal sarcosine oxidase [Plakobranchus ocellatus]